MTDLVQLNIEITKFVLMGKTSINGNRLCLHPVVDEEIGAEIPFYKHRAQQIFSLFSEHKYTPKTFVGIIPKNVIFAIDNETKSLNLAWHSKSQVQKLLFSKNLKLKTDSYKVPNLIFQIKNGIFKVFAISDKDAKNITEETNLFEAPFFNVNSYGQICMGNVNITAIANFQTFDAIMVFLEKSFWNSYFTHSNNKNVTEKYIENNKNNKNWNEKNLFPIKNLTVKNLIHEK